MNGSDSAGLPGLRGRLACACRAPRPRPLMFPAPPALPRSACTPAVPCLPMYTLQEQRSNCPFQQSGLKRWDNPSTWGGRVPTVSGLGPAPHVQLCIFG